MSSTEHKYKITWATSTPPKVYDIGICSGYFNPPTDGHISYINAAAKRCKRLFVIVNNDGQVKLKGGIPLMDEELRCDIMEQWEEIKDVFLSCDKDETVCITLKYINDNWKMSTKDTWAFFNSGDRKRFNQKEHETCQELGIDEVFLDLPKINSSSKIVKEAFENWAGKDQQKTEPKKELDMTTMFQYQDVFRNYFVEENQIELVDNLNKATIKIQCARRVFLCGNGGSQSIASHLSQDLMKTAKIPAYSMEGSSLITSCSNDYGYNNAYKAWLGLNNFDGEEGDVLIAISSSGNSKNIFNAILFAGVRNTIALTAFDEKNSINNMCSLNPPHDGVRFHIPTHSYGIAECYHAIILHIILDVIVQEKSLK